jgi:hypothetical protein
VHQNVEFCIQNALKLAYAHLKIHKFSRVCTSGPDRYKGEDKERKEKEDSEILPQDSFFKKVGAYGIGV